MKPLIVLLVTFCISVIVIRLLNKKYNWMLSGRIAMSAMLLFTSLGHFMYTRGMEMMLPHFIPFKTEVVYFTGIIEILAAIGLQIPKLQVITGWLLILFFLLILPANVYAALNQVDYQQATLEGNGTNYLWFRIPLQILFILWVYFSAIRRIDLVRQVQVN